MKKTVLSLPAVLALSVVWGLLSCGSRGGMPATLSAMLPGTSNRHEALPFAWPPKRGEAYPDVTLLDRRGQRVALSSFRGKVLQVELAGMTWG